MSAVIPYSLLSRLRPDKRGIPMLTNMTIRASDRPARRRAVPLGFGPNTPSLVSVDFRDFSFASIRISWRTVTSVRLDTLSVDECFELFQQGPNIIECEIDYISGTGNEHLNPSDELVHRSLRNLTLSLEDGVSGSRLSKLLLPSLEYFSYNAGRASVLQAFLAHSSYLTSLSIACIEGTEEQALEALRTTPCVEQLVVFASPLANQFLHTLATTVIYHGDDGSRHSFLPSLKDLIWCDVPGCLSWRLIPLLFPFGPLLSTDHQRRLKKVEINICGLDANDYIEEEVLKEILGILERGIKLHISDADRNADFIAHSEEYYESLDSREGTD